MSECQPDALRQPGALRPEFQLVCACCSGPEGREARITAALDLLAHSDTDAPETDGGLPPPWKLVLKITKRHRVAGLVFRALQDQVIPQPVLDVLSQEALQQTILATRLALETVLVQRILHRAGVPVVFPKGTALARRLYHDVAPRHSRDVDAFTTPQAMPTAHAALIAAGYKKIFPKQPFRDLRALRQLPGHSLNYADPSRGLLIELHWAFDENPTLDPCPGQPAPLTVLPEDVAGEDILSLPDTDLMIYLCLHGSSHSWMRLKWLADIAALIPQLQDLPGIIETARARHLIRPISVALILCREMMGWNMPDSIADRLSYDKGTRRMVRASKRTLLGGNGGTTPYEVRFGTTRLRLGRMWLKPGLRFQTAELRCIAGTFFDNDTTPYIPRALRPLFPLLKIPFWLVKQSRTGRG